MYQSQIRYEDFAKICRFCIMRSTYLSPLFQKQSGKLNDTMSDIIDSYLGIKMNNSDGLPTSICSICLEKLISFSSFRKQTASNTIILNTILNDSKMKSLPGAMVETVPVMDGTESDGADAAHIEYVDETIQLEVVPIDGHEELVDNDIYEISIEHGVDGKMDEFLINAEREEFDSIDVTDNDNSDDDDDGDFIGDQESSLETIDQLVIKPKRPKPKRPKPKRLNRITSQHKCDVCGKLVVNLRPHMETHVASTNRRKPYQCEYCGKEYLQRAQFEGHVNKEHTGLRPFECDQCDKTFHGRPSLRMHKMQHSTLRRYKCEFCPKNYIYAHHLSYHRYTHTKERQFACELCDFTSVYAEHLKRHILSKHTEGGDKPYQCVVCSRSFNGISNLKRHMKRIHSTDQTTVN